MKRDCIRLIEYLTQNDSNDEVIVICTIISVIIALISLLISLYLGFLQFKDRLARKKVLGYIYNYYSPTYVFDKLPTTKMIKKDLKNIFISEDFIFSTLIELNKENIIEAVADLNTDMENIKWKPNLVFYNNNK